MNQQQRAEVSAKWALTAAMYGKDLNRPMLTMMLDAVSDLDPQAILSALTNWVKTSKLQRHPLPVEIRELVSPSVSNDSLAKEAAARIPEAIKKFGYTDPESAKAFIGSLGWNVVNRFGGWAHVCQYHGTPEMNALTFQAQARDLARSHLEFSAAGKLGVAPEISTTVQTSNQLSSASQIIKTLISTNKECENIP